MNTRQLISSVAGLVFVAALVVGGTGAFFTDTETSTGNVFTAGDVDIEIDAISHIGSSDDEVVGFTTDNDSMSFAFADLKPLDAGTVTFNLENIGNPITLCAMVDNVGEAENSLIEPEDEAGDESEENGELDNFLTFSFGDETGTLADAAGQWVTLGEELGEGTEELSFGYCFGDFDGADCVLDDEANYNLAQTDSVSADVKFYAIQTRNNEDFDCDSLNVPTITEGGTTFELSGGVRYRSFTNTGGEEVYLGKTDLGTGANRVAQNVTWPASPGSSLFAFSYDQVADKFVSDVNGTNPPVAIEYANVTTNVCAPGDINKLQLLVRGHTTANVTLTDFTVDGVNLGDFTAGATQMLWTVSNIDLTDGLLVTGSIDTTGTLSSSQEQQKVEILVGCEA